MLCLVKLTRNFVQTKLLLLYGKRGNGISTKKEEAETAYQRKKEEEQIEYQRKREEDDIAYNRQKEQRDFDFTREKHRDEQAYRNSLLAASREVSLAYAKNQPKTITKNIIRSW